MKRFRETYFYIFQIIFIIFFKIRGLVKGEQIIIRPNIMCYAEFFV